jgi:hypothetical protein
MAYGSAEPPDLFSSKAYHDFAQVRQAHFTCLQSAKKSVFTPIESHLNRPDLQQGLPLVMIK